MVKRTLIFALTFAIALGGGTAAAVMRAKPEVASSKPAASDSAAKPAGPDSSAVRDSIAPSDSAKIVKDSTPKAVVPLAVPAKAVVPTAAMPTVVAPTAVVPAVAAPAPVAAGSQPIAPVTSLLAGGRLSKIFGAMSARDAAKVLEQMDDADIKEILGRLNDKKAAEILALLPSARAATISKAALTNPATNK